MSNVSVSAPSGVIAGRARCDDASIRAALVSARRFADCLEYALEGYGGLGPVPIETALDLLTEDARAPADSPLPRLTRFRLALGLKKAVERWLVVEGLSDRLDAMNKAGRRALPQPPKSPAWQAEIKRIAGGFAQAGGASQAGATARTPELDAGVDLAADLARENFGRLGSSVRPLLSPPFNPTPLPSPRPHASFPEVLALLTPLANEVLNHWSTAPVPGAGVAAPRPEDLYLKGRRVIVDELLRLGLQRVPSLVPIRDRIEQLCTLAANNRPEYQRALDRLAPGLDDQLTTPNKQKGLFAPIRGSRGGLAAG